MEVTARGATQAKIDVLNLVDHRKKTLAPGGHTGRYLPTSKESGHLVYTIQSTLFAVPFDPNALELRGSPVPILDDVAVFSIYRGAECPTTVFAKPGGTVEDTTLGPLTPDKLTEELAAIEKKDKGDG